MNGSNYLYNFQLNIALLELLKYFTLSCLCLVKAMKLDQLKRGVSIIFWFISQRLCTVIGAFISFDKIK